MNHNDDFEKIKRKAYLSYHQDGLIDILLGTAILVFGLLLLTDSMAFNILAWMPILFYIPLKNLITVPRFGFVRFNAGEEQQLKKQLQFSLLAGVMVLALIAGVYIFMTGDGMNPGLSIFLDKYHMLLLGGFLALALLIGGLLNGLRRLLLHAGLILTLFLAGIELSIPEHYFIITTGILILFIGSFYLVRFLRQYPLSTEHKDNV